MDCPHTFVLVEISLAGQSFGFAHFLHPKFPAQQSQEMIFGTPVHHNLKRTTALLQVYCFG
jgi:hypothetical protein